jgi:hypothetical protein
LTSDASRIARQFKLLVYRFQAGRAVDDQKREPKWAARCKRSAFSCDVGTALEEKRNIFMCLVIFAPPLPIFGPTWAQLPAFEFEDATRPRLANFVRV